MVQIDLDGAKDVCDLKKKVVSIAQDHLRDKCRTLIFERVTSLQGFWLNPSIPKYACLSWHGPRCR